MKTVSKCEDQSEPSVSALYGSLWGTLLIGDKLSEFQEQDHAPKNTPPNTPLPVLTYIWPPSSTTPPPPPPLLHSPLWASPKLQLTSCFPTTRRRGFPVVTLLWWCYHGNVDYISSYLIKCDFSKSNMFININNFCFSNGFVKNYIHTYWTID